MARFNVRPDIDDAAERLSQTIGAKREIQRLPEVLWESESIDTLATGSYGGGMGLLAMTNMRLLFYKNGVMKQTLEDFPLGNISSVQWSSGFATGTLAVFASGNKAEITQVPKADGKALSDRLRIIVAQGGAAPAPAPAAPAPQAPVTWPAATQAPAAPAAPAAGDVASRLATLDQLRAAGAITDAEYQERRTAILNSL